MFGKLFDRMKPSRAAGGIADAILNRVQDRDVKLAFKGKLKVTIGGQPVEIEAEGVIDPIMNDKFIDLDGDGKAD